MVKKPTIYDYDDDDNDIVVDKKAKRKMAKAASKVLQQQQAAEEEGDDTMSRVAILCQGMRWREAVSLCRTSLEAARAENRVDACMTLEMALPKLEYSLRRQQAAALIRGAQKLLQKENQPDVGE